PLARGPDLPEEAQGILPSWVLARASHSARRLAGRHGRIGFTLCHLLHVTYYGRVVHLRQLPTSCCHDAVAFGYRRVNVSPDGDFHPAVWTPSQAHERGQPCPLDSHLWNRFARTRLSAVQDQRWAALRLLLDLSG